MSSTTLILKNQKSENTTRIICLLTDGRGVRIKIYSNYSIKPKHWSKKSKTVLSANSNATEINVALKNLNNKVLNIYEEAKRNGIIANAEYIKEQIKPKDEPKKENKTFWNVWTYYLEANRNKFMPSSLKKLKSFSKHLLKFEDFKKIPLELDKITGITLDNFQSYFYEQVNLNTQTTAKYIGIFKMFLNWAFKHNYTTNSDHKQFTAIQQPDSLKVVFTDEDIELIKEIKLGDKEYLKNVRELLLLSTLTGLRYSDFSTIRKEHLKHDDEGTPILYKRQEKTGDFVELPLTPEAERITKGIIYGGIHTISNQKMNKYVKELCQLAGVDEMFEVHKFKGKMKLIKYQPKHELVSTHTGRRTFATNLLLKGLPAETVMEFTGHRDYKSFAKYVNIPKKVKMKAVKMALMG